MGVYFTDDQDTALAAINTAFSTVSLIGALFVVVCYLRFKDIRSFAFTLVFCCSLNDLAQSVANMFGDASASSGVLCQAQALLVSYFGLGSLLWTVAIAFTLWMGFVLEHEPFSPARIGAHSGHYHALC